MHLKNFSLITRPGREPVLSPAYDMVCKAILNPADDEEIALTLKGKKRKIRRGDIVPAFNAAGLDKKRQRKHYIQITGLTSGLADRDSNKFF